MWVNGEVSLWVNGDVSLWPIFVCKNGPKRNVPIDPKRNLPIDLQVVAIFPVFLTNKIVGSSFGILYNWYRNQRYSHRILSKLTNSSHTGCRVNECFGKEWLI